VITTAGPLAAGGELATVAGLPAHILLVHTVVVGVPLAAAASAVAAVAVARRATARVEAGTAGRFARAVAAVNLALVALAWLTAEAGESLRGALGGPSVAAEHAALGEDLPWFVAALAVSSLLPALARGRVRPARAGVVLVLLTALAAVVWTVRVGHSGAASVWGGVAG